MVGNLFADSYTHLSGQTISNIDKEINSIRGDWAKPRRAKAKEREAKAGATKTTTTTTTTITATTTNKINLNKRKRTRERSHRELRKSTSTKSSTKCWICGMLGHRVASCWFNNQKNVNNIQQQQLPPQHQQFQLQGTSDQPISYMPPEGIATFNFQQLPQQQEQQPQIQYHPVRQALPSTTSASSTTRVSTPGPHISDVSSINKAYICEGEQLPGIGRHHHIFDISQLNRKHLRHLPRGLLRRWEILCDTGAVTSIPPRNFADHVPLQPHYTQLALPQQPINPSTSMATKTSC